MLHSQNAVTILDGFYFNYLPFITEICNFIYIFDNNLETINIDHTLI